MKFVSICLQSSQITIENICKFLVNNFTVSLKHLNKGWKKILYVWFLNIKYSYIKSKLSMAFPVVMYGCKSWIIKKAECRRIDAFELWFWRRLLRIHWTARRSNQSILKEINLECSLERLMLKLKFQYFGHLIRRANSWEKTGAGKDWRQKEKGATEEEMVGWHHQLNGCEFEQTVGDSEGQGSLVCCRP